MEKTREPSKAEIIKSVLDNMDDETREELKMLISKNPKVPVVKNKIELQVG
jgi:hypothetical protein